MNIRNHMLLYRPILGGVCVYNPLVNTYGTAGLIAVAAGANAAGDRWLVSCYHVLARADLSPFTVGEEIFQPWGQLGTGTAAARLEAGDSNLDCAAARLEAGVSSVPRVLGIGHLGPVAEPSSGMRVLKSGIATGVTEGVVDAVQGDKVTIVGGSDRPPKYDVAGVGDSGAVWVDAATRSPVALHRASTETLGETAIATRMSSVLSALGLRLLV